MSRLDHVLRAALDAGVELALIDGTLTIKGKRRVLAEHRPRLSEFKAELLQRFASNDPAPPLQEPATPPLSLEEWRSLARAYDQHHFRCSTCVAAGLGLGGLRCGTGTSLWSSYTDVPQPYYKAV